MGLQSYSLLHTEVTMFAALDSFTTGDASEGPWKILK